MVYGDGVGFALADDVVAHELTHGVTEHTSNLFYYYQSGAINESLSDIWGEFVDQTNLAGNDSASVKWLIGEDVIGLGAIRDMEDPTTFGDPDRMTSPSYWFSMGDSGGVHTNSGINNKAAYLMVEGGSFNGQTVTALGITKVAAIYYEVQTNLLTSGADYADLHDALFQACNNLIGTGGITSVDCQQVQNAATAVEMDLQPTPGFNTDAPICSPGDVVNTVFFDDLESGAGNFGTITPIGTVRWTYGSPYGPFAHSGQNFLYGDDFPGAVTDSSVVTTGGVVLPASAYLHFAHAFGFEAPDWDGGVVEYSTNGGATWIDAGSLFDANGYGGVLTTSSGNPLGGRSAFVSDSHGYISSRLDLSSLAGQTVRFRWRMGLDQSVFNWGWWLDDVHVYTCTANSAPVAQDDAFTVVADSVDNPLDVLANDTDPGDTLTITTVDTTGTVGTAVIDDNGTAADPTDDVIKYTPLPGFAGLDSFSYTIEDSGALSDTATVTVTVTPVGGGLVVDFNGYAIQSYGGSQDETPTAYAVEDGGATLHLMGNTWKAIELTPAYAVTPNTVLEFDFRSDGDQAEINGIGLDTQRQSIKRIITFAIYGTQNWGRRDFYGYGGGWQHYVIPVGAYYAAGARTYLFFANDADAGQNTSVRFRNVLVHE